MSSRPGTIELIDLVLPNQTNHHGTLFAGQGLQLMAKAAFLAARSKARKEVVMAGVKNVDFFKPVPVGHTISLQARVIRIGRASMTVEVVGTTMLPSEPPQEVLKGTFEMVAIDAAGRPSPIDRSYQEEPL